MPDLGLTLELMWLEVTLSPFPGGESSEAGPQSPSKAPFLKLFSEAPGSHVVAGAHPGHL